MNPENEFLAATWNEVKQRLSGQNSNELEFIYNLVCRTYLRFLHEGHTPQDAAHFTDKMFEGLAAAFRIPIISDAMKDNHVQGVEEQTVTALILAEFALEERGNVNN